MSKKLIVKLLVKKTIHETYWADVTGLSPEEIDAKMKIVYPEDRPEFTCDQWEVDSSSVDATMEIVSNECN